MKNLPYALCRELAVNLGTLTIPISFLAGYLIGTQSYLLALILASIYFIMDNLVARLWVRIYEENNFKHGSTKTSSPEHPAEG